MIRKTCDSYPISIFIATPPEPKWHLTAEAICGTFCDEIGFCVTVTRTRYVYTGGSDQGVIVGIINYPRFPLSAAELRERAEQLAERLREGLLQDSYTIQAPDGTLWISHRANDGVHPHV